MDLAFNVNPRFTKWLASSGTLREPFVVIDVGVQGGESPRWHFFGDHLIVHGFDAIREAINALSETKAPGRNYHWMAIGNEDGEREFFFKSDNPTNSTFYESRTPEHQVRAVPIRKLDTLLAEGLLPKADFLKVDVEGFERDVFLGAAAVLPDVLGVEFETNFNSSPIYPDTHFGFVLATLHQRGLVLVDLNFNRVRSAAYQEARRRRALPDLPVEGAGRPATVNVLFCRQALADLGIDRVLKLIAVYELHGLNDIATATAVAFSAELGQRLDVERVIDLLCLPEPKP